MQEKLLANRELEKKTQGKEARSTALWVLNYCNNTRHEQLLLSGHAIRTILVLLNTRLCS
jgi:hypothetical protein